MSKKTYRARINLEDMRAGPANNLFRTSAIVPVFDMLRYENARVVEVSASSIVIETPNPITMGRWLSFGLAPTIL